MIATVETVTDGNHSLRGHYAGYLFNLLEAKSKTVFVDLYFSFCEEKLFEEHFWFKYNSIKTGEKKRKCFVFGLIVIKYVDQLHP